MAVQKIEYERVIGTYDGKEYDFDRYNIDIRRALSTHEYSVVVDHKKKEIYGDVSRYGSLDDLITEEVQELMELLEKEGKIARPYPGYLYTEKN